MTRPPAVVLLSGGLDSATCLAIACADGFETHAMSFRYGQRHTYELECACRVAVAQGASSHRVVDLDLAQFGGSALTNKAIPVPKHDTLNEIASDIPVTYVPARNTVFLSLALALAEVTRSQHIYIGVNALDYSGYPDCRPEFIAAFEQMANLATKSAVASEHYRLHIQAPLQHMTKAQIIARGLELGVDYGLTSSCYDPQASRPCGRCDACLLRAKGFAENGIRDPAL
jgi:7-cyano-7-deazaguanine synthase